MCIFTYVHISKYMYVYSVYMYLFTYIYLEVRRLCNFLYDTYSCDPLCTELTLSIPPFSPVLSFLDPLCEESSVTVTMERHR